MLVVVQFVATWFERAALCSSFITIWLERVLTFEVTFSISTYPACNLDLALIIRNVLCAPDRSISYKGSIIAGLRKIMGAQDWKLYSNALILSMKFSGNKVFVKHRNVDRFSSFVLNYVRKSRLRTLSTPLKLLILGFSPSKSYTPNERNHDFEFEDCFNYKRATTS